MKLIIGAITWAGIQLACYAGWAIKIVKDVVPHIKGLGVRMWSWLSRSPAVAS